MRFSIIIDQHDATDGIYLHIVPSPTSEWLDHAEEASTGFMVASVGGLSEGHRHGGPGVCLGDGQPGGLSEGYRHDEPGVCLGDGQTEAEGVPWQGGRAAPAYVPIPDLT